MAERSAVGPLLTEDEFIRSFRIGLISAWLIPPITGLLGMTFLGFWEMQDAIASLIRFTGPYVVAVTGVVYVIFRRRIIDRVAALGDEGHELSPSDINSLKAFPWAFWGLLTLYCAAGPPTVLLSNAVFDGKAYGIVDYAGSAFGVIPFLLISAAPLFYYLTNLLGRYLGPRGVVVAVAPVWLKVTVLGLFIPVMIDTVLLTYYFDRTGFLSVETLALWLLLIVAAAISTMIAVRSFRQGLYSLERPLSGISATDDQSRPIPSSLDEFGMLAHGWADLLTARDRAEDKAKQQEWLVRSIIDNTYAVICIKDTEGRYVMANSRFKEIFGLADDAIKGKTDHELFSEDIANALRQHDLQVMRDEKSLEFQENVVDQDGAHTYISLKFPLYDTAGVLYGVCSVSTDITERQRLEEALKESEEQLKAIIDNSPSGITIKDVEGKFLLVNKTYAGWVNGDAEEIAGKTVSDLFSKQLAEEINKSDRQVFSDGKISVREVTRSFGSGVNRSLLNHKIPFIIGPGQAPAIITIMTDLTEIKVTEAALRQSQKMEAVGQLTGGLAHDFNNLLSIMSGNSELLESDIGENDGALYKLKAIQGAVTRASSLTHRLLAFSRQQTLMPVAADICDLIGNLKDMLQRTLGEMVDLKFEATPDLWTATIDPHQFENALVNLAINARDAMPGGGILVIEAANITLGETYAAQHQEVTAGDYVSVAVSDSGTGMTPEVRDKVFEPFFTTKDVGEGSGLGLSMVYGFTKQSNGHITIYSEVDHGTTVKLYLPRSKKALAKKETKTHRPKFAPGSERILIIEDDVSVREVPVNMLRDLGYQVVEAADGKEAIQHLMDDPPFDLLFTDVILPGGMNGIEIAEEAIAMCPNIKVLYTTGYAENFVLRHGRLDPEKALLSKPYRLTDLLAKIRAMLDSEGN